MRNLLQYKFERYKLDVSLSEYVYTQYNVNETFRSDEQIKREEILDSYVRLPIVFNMNTSTSQINYLKSKNESMFAALQDKIENINVFNKINSYSRDFFRYYHDKENDNIKRVFEKYNITNNNKELFYRHQNTGYVLNVNKKKEENFLSLNKKNITYNFNDFKSHKNNILSSPITEGIEWFESNPTINLGMIPFSEKISYEDRNINNESVCVGFLIEKFSIDKKRLAAKFIYNKTIFDSLDSSTINNIEHNIIDSNVKYGKTYTYIVFPVFLVTIPKQNDYHVVQDILVCDSPYITEVSCKEFEKPNVPNKIFVNFYKEKKNLLLEWSRPYNIEHDIKGYIVFKRSHLNEAFKAIGVIDFASSTDFFSINSINLENTKVIKTNEHTNNFKDNDFNVNKISIYAICAYDAHGNFSNYSEQLLVIYNMITKKIEVELVSLSEAPLHLPNIHIPRNIKYFDYHEPIEDVVPIIKNKKKATLYCTPDFVEIENTEGTLDKLLKENYIVNIFKLENQKFFKDVITIKNFNNINNE